MNFKKQIVMFIMGSLLFTSCSLKLKAGIIKHDSNNNKIEETINKVEYTNKNTEEHINKQEEKITEEEKEVFVGKVKEEFEELIGTLSQTTDEMKIKELLKDNFENCTSFKITNIYFATEEGEFYLVPEIEFAEGYDARERDWYSSTKSDGEGIASFVDAATGMEVASVYFAVNNGENIIGVLGVDIEQENAGQ
ncbi:PDC sensor domain-containing protein [Oceanirhabdus sp. W0125-5]|uniref:PDC sensor domain-containing protein n=1 Tax=Oceanirhabdus sp. W0125-5 TaxID=2999116 RepID=UPI0022F2BCCD|nr:hypothetical protein [Oceanirhabdus sp. W0125-5]WBW97051.1 hypothetical protein OW730_25670 [Oceanirhabdus sp. W0125-5]